jgi:hypothetical protein
MTRRLRSGLFGVLLVVPLLVAAPAAAESGSGERVRVEVPMQVTGRAVPTGNGYRLEAFRDPVPGDCGTSYVEIEPFFGGFDLYTGFTVFEPAIEYSWNATVIGPAYDDGETWGGNLAFRTRWDGTWLDQRVDFSGEYDAIADGYAILSDLRICSSNVPTDTVYIES